jgi:CheY-like chemotaxis protein
VLLIDDEPEYLTWVVEFFDSLGIRSEKAQTIGQALDMMSRQKYDLLLIDMNIPPGGATLDQVSKGRSAMVEHYPGIALAFYSRNNGYEDFQVIAYTVHDDDAADAELQRLNCRYVLKGRPEVLKLVVRRSIEKLQRLRRSQGKARRTYRPGGMSGGVGHRPGRKRGK